MPSPLALSVKIPLNDGNSIPAQGFGTVAWDGNQKAAKQQVIEAVKAGYRHIDTAWYYGVEKWVGEGLKELFDQGVVKREEIFVTTKVWPSFAHSPEKSLDKSLADLQLDYVDLFLQHWPVEFKGDPNGIPPEPKNNKGEIIYDDDPVSGTKYLQVYQELERIKDETNKVKSIGVSNYSISKLEPLIKVAKHIPVVNQIEYHPLLPQADLIDFCKRKNIVVECYSPYGSVGAPILKLPLVQELAEKYGVQPAEVANAYHILEDRVTLPRSSNLERIQEVIHLPQLTQDEIKKLYQLGVKEPKRFRSDPYGRGLGFKWWDGDKWSKIDE